MTERKRNLIETILKVYVQSVFFRDLTDSERREKLEHASDILYKGVHYKNGWFFEYKGYKTFLGDRYDNILPVVFTSVVLTLEAVVSKEKEGTL